MELISKGNGDAQIELNQHKPILPIHDFDDIVLQLKYDPHCGRCSHGYVSVTKLPNGSKVLNLCRHCATFGETDLLKVLKAVGIICQMVDSSTAATSEVLIRVEKKLEAFETARAEDRTEFAKVLASIGAKLNEPRGFRKFVNSIRRLYAKK